jgi:FMN-dependent NADH-azoreductase/putative sterol carrier protein
MKVLALNSSPRKGDQSKTELMLSHLVQGMREAGAEVEVINLRDKKIRFCSGCFTCWTKTPGVCVHQDDMTKELYPKWLAADLAVYATPLYHFTLNANLKAFIERTLPAIEPFLVEKNGHTSHPIREKMPAAVMLSVAGFPEHAIFDLLSSWTRFIFHKNLWAEIYRPAAESMISPAHQSRVKDILEATVQAGRELVNNQGIAPATMERVLQPVMDDNHVMHVMGNVFWKTCIAEGVTIKEFVEKGLTPRPDSLETFMIILPMAFKPDGAAGLTAVIEFKFTGEVEDACHFKIENGGISACSGPSTEPSMTISCPFELWMDIMTGKADGQKAFLDGRYQVSGDMELLMRFGELFGK